MGTTELCEDYVFLTENHDHASADAIWLVKRFEPGSYHVQFYRVEQENKVGIVSVRCSEKEVKLTNVTVSYKYIALSEHGRKFIESFTEETYIDYIDEWKKLLIKYFEKQG